MLRAALTILTILATHAYGQYPLDSLWRAFQGQKVSREQLVTLHQIITEMRSVDQDSCLNLSHLLVDRAREQHDTLMIGQGYRDVGIAHLMMRSSEPALKALDSALFYYSTRLDSAFLRGAGAAESNMAYAHKNSGRLKEAMHHYLLSLGLHERANDPEGAIYCYNGIGRIYEIQGKHDSALYYYERVVSEGERIGMDDMVGGGYGNMGNVYTATGRIGEAIDATYKSLAILERISDLKGVAACLTTISELKRAIGEDQEALDLLRRAYDLYQKADYRQGMMTSGSSIGALLMEMNEADSAIVMLETALQLEREGDVKDLMGRTLLELGTVYRLVGRTADAERILNEALILAQSLNDQPSEAQAFAKLGRTSLDKGAIQQAIQRCTKGLTLADKNLISTERRDNCECLYLAYKAQGNGLKALQFHETFISIRDSLVNDRAQRQLTQRDLLYTFGKQQLADSLAYASEREQLESERMIESLRADQNRNRALATGIGGILLLGGGIAWFITDRRRRQERFEKESATLETQALRSQMNPHFIFNALNSINAFVQKNDQDSATSYLSKFARVMRLVLENSRHAEVPLNDDLEALRGYLDLERMRMEKKFDFTITVDQTIDPEEVMVPPLVVQPFVENAIWHGMAGKEGKGHITLSVARRGSQMVWTIEDDGAGRHAKKEASPLGQPMKKTSLGTAITRSRLDLVQKQHGGKAGFHYTDLPQGTRVEVEIPFLNA